MKVIGLLFCFLVETFSFEFGDMLFLVLDLGDWLAYLRLRINAKSMLILEGI